MGQYLGTTDKNAEPLHDFVNLTISCLRIKNTKKSKLIYTIYYLTSDYKT